MKGNPIQLSAKGSSGKASATQRELNLEAAAEVGQAAVSIHDPNKLLPFVVDVIVMRFGFYYAAIYLLEEQKKRIKLRAASGEAGEAMLAAQHGYNLSVKGIISEVATTGKAHISLDVSKDKQFLKNPNLPNTSSEAALPLSAGGKLLGVLDVQSEQKNAFSEDDLVVLKVLADQVSVAIQNAELFDSVQRQLAEISVLHKIGLAAISAQNEDELLKEVTRLVGETLYPNNFGFLLYNPERTHLIHHSSYTEQVGANLDIPPLNHGICWQVAQTGQAIRINDISQEPDYVQIDLHALSEMCVPLKIGKKVIGVINTESHKSGAFSENDELMLSTISNQLGTVLENFRLRLEEQRRAEELRGLYEIAEAFKSLTNIEETYGTLAEKIGKLIGAEICIVGLYDPITKYIEAMAPGYGVSDEMLLKTRFKSYDLKKEWDFREKGTFLANTPEDVSSYFKPFIERYNLHNVLVAPLFREGRFIGAVYAINKPSGFTQDDAHLIGVFAGQAGAVIENSRLFTEAQERAMELALSLEQQEELDRLKSEFIQNVSHELRTPLSIIKGYSDLLKDRSLGEMDENYSEPIEIISRRVEMLHQMVSDLTAILEAQTIGLPKEPVDLSALASREMEDFSVTAQKAHILLDTNIEHDLPLVQGDPQLLRRVMDNLLGNAVKFTPAKGTISVRLFRKDDHLQLEVSDTGPGIPPGEEKKIFDRFYQVDGSMTRKHGGTGLGLALVKEIVDDHGGDVSVVSQLNIGSTFTVRLPISISPKQ